MVTTWGHDPHFIPIENLLAIINDTLKDSPVLIQVTKNLLMNNLLTVYLTNSNLIFV